MKEIINKFTGTRILAIGDLMLDQYLYGTVTRISPEAPVPIVQIDKEVCELGGTAKVINNINNLDGTVEAVGIIGNEDAGRTILNLLKERNVNIDGIIISNDRPTTVRTRIIGNNSHIVRFEKENRKKIGAEISDQIIEYIKNKIKNYDAILISDYDTGLITPFLSKKLIDLANSNGIPIIVNSKTENLIQYKKVSVIISDYHKVSNVIGIKPINETSIRNIGQWMLTRLDCKGIIIMQGEKGISVFSRDGAFKHLPIITKGVTDITGVEDAIISVVTLAVANGSNMIDAAMIANTAAAIVLNKTGNYTPSKEELLELIQ
ncbi:MAG: PfkB family carbohydrate kinase [Candidatus Methanoperedens sp.]|nr:PfkB family carbohydrate kinase [Candidatus Methanoperedens sp.]